MSTLALESSEVRALARFAHIDPETVRRWCEDERSVPSGVSLHLARCYQRLARGTSAPRRPHDALAISTHPVVVA
jgi:hypothetical protein